MIKFVVKSFFERACACVPGRARPLRLGGSSFRSCFRRMGFIRLLMGLAVEEGRKEGGRDGANERCWLLALASMGKEEGEEEEENRKGAFNMGDPGGSRILTMGRIGMKGSRKS